MDDGLLLNAEDASLGIHFFFHAVGLLVFLIKATKLHRSNVNVFFFETK